MQSQFRKHAASDLLIVDDEIPQVRLFELLIQQLGLLHRCHHALNGSQALAFLRQEHPYQNAPRPRMIIMDLNMPGLSGCEVLKIIKSDRALLNIPVIMLSNSQRDEDVNACYAALANAYIRKPADLSDNLRIVEELDRFWFHTVVLPSDVNAFLLGA